MAHGIGETAPPLVEQQDARERREPLDVLDESRLLPRGQQVGERPPNEDEVDGALADDLAGERGVAAAGVLNVGNLHQPPVS